MKLGHKLSSLPDVSVVIPCYNASKWIYRSVESVLSQESINVEVIVIDDGSIDDSLQIVRSFGHRIYWKSISNSGACAARNVGLSLTNSEHVLFLDADDYLEQGSLKNWLSLIKDSDILFGPWARDYDGIRILAAHPSISKGKLSIMLDWHDGNFVPTCSVLWRKDFLLSIGSWKEDLLVNQDGELVLRAILSGARFVLADSGLGLYVQHNSSNRVSRRTDPAAYLSEFIAFKELINLVPINQADLRYALGRFFYSFARRAFQFELNELAQEQLMLSRSLGFSGHLGSRSHILISSIIGLKLKDKLAKWMRNFLFSSKGSKLRHF